MLNAGATIERCLDALSRQDVPRETFEVLVVDNGSTDSSRAMAVRGQADRVLHEPRRGSYRARNLGVRSARGDTCVFLDADCVPDPDWLRGLLAALSRRGVLLVCGRRRNPGVDPLMRAIEAYETERDRRTLNGTDAATFYGYTCNMAVRREALEGAELFLEIPRGADTILVQRVAARHGATAIAWCDATVTHLEMDRVSVYFTKKFVYGREREAHRGLGGPLAIPLRVRIGAARVALEETGLGAIDRARFLGSLAVAALCWGAGRATGRLAGSPGGTPPS
jgi:glycosyltransferase involved in cell wall biosynthesis